MVDFSYEARQLLDQATGRPITATPVAVLDPSTDPPSRITPRQPGTNNLFTLVTNRHGVTPQFVVDVPLVLLSPAGHVPTLVQNDLGVPGPKGDDSTVPGPEGRPGAGVQVLGSVATVGDLPAGVDERRPAAGVDVSADDGILWLTPVADGEPGADAYIGDAYTVGEHLYVWTGTEWEDTGEFRGPEGPPGPTATPSTDSGNLLTVGSDSLLMLDPDDLPAPVTVSATPFVVRWTGSAWQYESLAAAQSAGLDTAQTIFFVGGPSAPGWARTGDVLVTGT